MGLIVAEVLNSGSALGTIIGLYEDMVSGRLASWNVYKR